jgi:hypothetical protein
MKTATRPQYHRLQRILEMVREGTRAGSPPNCRHFIHELEVSRRTLMRDLDFLRDDHHAPIVYDDSRRGFCLTDPTFKLAPVELTQREVFSFSIGRKLLERFEGTPPEMDMRSVLDKIADSLQGNVSLDVESLTDQFTVLSEDHIQVEPEVWQRAGRAINQRECTRDYAVEPYHLAAAGRLETFALSRCRSLAGTGQHFLRPASFDPKAFFKDAFGVGGDLGCEEQAHLPGLVGVADGSSPGCPTSRSSLRANSRTACANACVRDWPVADDPAGLSAPNLLLRDFDIPTRFQPASQFKCPTVSRKFDTHQLAAFA